MEGEEGSVWQECGGGGRERLLSWYRKGGGEACVDKDSVGREEGREKSVLPGE